MNATRPGARNDKLANNGGFIGSERELLSKRKIRARFFIRIRVRLRWAAESDIHFYLRICELVVVSDWRLKK